MRMKMEVQGEASEYDSASKEPPAGQAALMAPLVKAMTAEAFTVHMKPSGEVVDVDIPETVAKALASTPGAAMMGEMATPEGLAKMVKMASFALPKELGDGAEWTTKIEIKNPMTGPQVAETTYKYDGPAEVEGKSLERFKPELKMSFGEGGAAAVDVQKQKSSGEFLFNREAGRLESSKLEQSMTLKIVMQGQTIDQQLQQTVTMKWMPEEEREEDATAEAKAEE
jgi:hypothetical protein